MTQLTIEHFAVRELIRREVTALGSVCLDSAGRSRLEDDLRVKLQAILSGLTLGVDLDVTCELSPISRNDVRFAVHALTAVGEAWLEEFQRSAASEAPPRI